MGPQARQDNMPTAHSCNISPDSLKMVLVLPSKFWHFWGLKIASLLGPSWPVWEPFFGAKPPGLNGDWLHEPTSQERYANIAAIAHLTLASFKMHLVPPCFLYHSFCLVWWSIGLRLRVVLADSGETNSLQVRALFLPFFCGHGGG